MAARGVEVAASLNCIERPTLEKDIRRLGDRRGLGQDVCDQPVDILVGLLELRRDCVRAEERRDAAGRCDGTQGRQLGFAVQPVA